MEIVDTPGASTIAKLCKALSIPATKTLKTLIYTAVYDDRSEAVAALGLLIAVVGIIGVSVVLSALNAIFQTALYHYANTGSVPGDYFDDANFAHAFVPRRR